MFATVPNGSAYFFDTSVAEFFTCLGSAVQFLFFLSPPGPTRTSSSIPHRNQDM